MEPMFIKIKFTPLIRQLENSNTICCLEIVPNISSIENLDKIEWNKKSDLIEYSVPVTYKVTLKKEQYKNKEKIYYSCINLTANSNLACGDLAQVISDNFILSKVEKSIFFSEPYNKDSIVMSDCLDKNVTKPEENRQVFQKLYPEISETAKDIVPDFNKIGTKVDPNTPEYGLLKNKTSNGTEERSGTAKNQNLTVTSICTFSTIDGREVDTDNERTIIQITNNVNIEEKREIDCKFNRESKLPPCNKIFFTSGTSRDHQIKTFKRQYCDRILPDMRVAHFMMTVEKEILPLRIMLGEIYRKCLSLGLLCKSSAIQTRNLQLTNQEKFVNNSKRKCNRVVYSIVFKG